MTEENMGNTAGILDNFHYFSRNKYYFDKKYLIANLKK